MSGGDGNGDSDRGLDSSCSKKTAAVFALDCNGKNVLAAKWTGFYWLSRHLLILVHLCSGTGLLAHWLICTNRLRCTERGHILVSANRNHFQAYKITIDLIEASFQEHDVSADFVILKSVVYYGDHISTTAVVGPLSTLLSPPYSSSFGAPLECKTLYDQYPKFPPTVPGRVP